MTRNLLFLLIFSCAFASCKQNHIQSIRIGNQTWMSMNLSTDHFRNGDEIPQAKTKEEWLTMCREGKPAWCYPMLNGEIQESYGKLYNWFAVKDPRGLAPDGWRIASDEDWSQLTDYLGGEGIAAFSLRTTGLNDNQQVESGFSGYPTGACKSDGTVFGFGSSAYWWTATETNRDNAWMRQLSYSPCSLNSLAYPKQAGMAVRCVKE
jgi:uncharacterized protein (TIGR02145 family)